MNRTEFMRQLESLLQNISATEREEALQYYNEYFNDAGPENEQNVIEALGNPAKVAENIKKDIFGNGYGENIYQKINADNRAVITYPADSGAKSGAGEAGFGQENEAQAAGAVSSRKKEGMSTGMIVLIVILCILASPVILGVASAGIGVAAGLIGAGLICGGVGLLFLMLTVAMAGIATPAICCWIGGLFQKRGKAEA